MIRRIKTKEEADKKTKRNQIIIGVVLVGLMVLSTVGYSFLSQDEKEVLEEEYNGFKFERVNSFWKLVGEEFYFQYLPQEIENVSVFGFYNLQSYSGKPLYFVNDNEASREILINLDRFVLRYQEACLNATNCTNEELPIKTCADNLIIFGIDETLEDNVDGKVWQDENCVFISGDFIKSSDSFLYKVLGVI